MDFYCSQDNYILRKGEYCLWCNRANGNLKLRPASSIKDIPVEPKCLGTVYGVVGKIQFLPGSDSKLVVITKHQEVGQLTDDSRVFRIDRIAVIPLSAEQCPEIDLEACEEHREHLPAKQVARDAQLGMTQTFNNLKTSLANQFRGSVKVSVQKTVEKEGREKEKLDKLERRLQEEFVKMFNDSESFFYSEGGDVTNTVQRNKTICKESRKLPRWKRADERFFWNKAMLKEIIAMTDSEPNANEWIVPIIQGYVQTAECEVDFSDTDFGDDGLTPLSPEKFNLILISRRSVKRAGTRYKRRGVDEDGHVANYVETEQIVRVHNHHLSYVQVRGSIPLYWSQAGIKYRPPPKLEKSKEESQQAMRRHFEKELALYKNVTIINLVDQSGREQVLGDALMEHIIAYDNPLMTYVTFDFHEYCRGMKFENISILVERLAEIATEDIRYCWVDNRGFICEQLGVFRVNCMDCLDRTNVVQAALARFVLKCQLRKLGRLMPEESLPSDIRETYQDMWANNGDAISRQYAGTAAMKGDFTRTGERRFTGVMKDGYHSANRYLNRFTAAYRQTVIDIMLGISPTEDISVLIAAIKQPEDPGEEWTMQREEWVAQLVEHCQQLLVSEGEAYLGGWALIEPLTTCEDEGPDLEQEVVLLLTEDSFYVASYDEDEECVNHYERQCLENLEKIEIGPDSSQKSRNSCLRLHYRCGGEAGYFHTFKALQNRTSDECEAVLRGIADELFKACEALQHTPRICECRLNKKKSKRHNVIQISTKTRPFSSDESRRSKNTGTRNNILEIVHSASAPAELHTLASLFPAQPPGSLSDDDVPKSDTPKDESTVRPNSNSRTRDQSCSTHEQNCSSCDSAEVVLGRSSNCAETSEGNDEDKPLTSNVQGGKRWGHRSEGGTSNESGGLDEPHKTASRSERKSTNDNAGTSSGFGNLKKSFKNKLGDVSVKFQKNRDSLNATEISWPAEGNNALEPARPTGKRSIFAVAQERGRTFIPDLRNKLSGLSNRSPRLEQRRQWVQIIKERDCKTKIIQI